MVVVGQGDLGKGRGQGHVPCSSDVMVLLIGCDGVCFLIIYIYIYLCENIFCTLAYTHLYAHTYLQVTCLYAHTHNRHAE